MRYVLSPGLSAPKPIADLSRMMNEDRLGLPQTALANGSWSLSSDVPTGLDQHTESRLQGLLCALVKVDEWGMLRFLFWLGRSWLLDAAFMVPAHSNPIWRSAACSGGLANYSAPY